MMKHRTLVGVAVLMLVSLVQAKAPQDQYESFDGSNPYVTDRYTHLTWERAPRGGFKGVVYIDANTQCPSGFRLPSFKELLSIIDEVQHKEQFGGDPRTLSIDGAAFGGDYADDGEFWTSTLGPDASRFVIEMGTGKSRKVIPSVSVTAKFRCVKYTP
jgi:hypothetical protein